LIKKKQRTTMKWNSKRKTRTKNNDDEIDRTRKNNRSMLFYLDEKEEKTKQKLNERRCICIDNQSILIVLS